ncbi:hypothetical protein [Psychrobacter sp. 28M-43]|nr:hypothetical protein [Psychrobacter sp. 28M-43]
MPDYKSPQEMEALALELLETELSLDMPAKTCPICGSNVESN